MKNIEIKSEIITSHFGGNNCIVHFPVITHPQNQPLNSINNFSRYSAEKFADEVLNSTMPYLPPNNLTILRCWQLMYKSRFVLSYKYEISTYDKNLTYKTSILGAVWNIKYGSSFCLKDFFKKNVRFKELILYILCSKIKDRISKGEVFYPDWYARLYASFDKAGFYLCLEGFVFIFPDGSLKEEHNFHFEQLISYMELKNQLELKFIL